ncbi:MAG: hypothetical protein PUF45_01930, partial [Lachnospiraceae bacterium]|nr:hypothetical protein [Lachnospiraceae bacterium]
FSMHAKPENLARQYAEKIPVAEKHLVFQHVRHAVNLVMNRSIGGGTSGKANHMVIARIHRNSAGQEGVLYSVGQRFGGYSFYIKDNRLKYSYNANTQKHFDVVSDIELPLGDVKVAFSFLLDETGERADVTLYINDQQVGTVVVEQLAYMVGFSTSLLANPYSPVTPDYESPFEFTGRADEIILHQYPTEVDPLEELKKLSNIE